MVARYTSPVFGDIHHVSVVYPSKGINILGNQGFLGFGVYVNDPQAARFRSCLALGYVVNATFRPFGLQYKPP